MHFNNPADALAAREQALRFAARLQQPAMLLGSLLPVTRNPPVDLFGPGPQPPARLYPEGLPPTLPLVVPFPDECRVLGSATRPDSDPFGGPVGESIAIVAESALARGAIGAFYARYFEQRGWTRAASDVGYKLFVGTVTFCSSANGPWLSLGFVTSPEHERQQFVLQLNTACAGPCADLETPMELGGRLVKLARSAAAQGLEYPRVSGLDWSGGNEGWWGHAVMAWPGTADELQAHLGAQLRTLAWVEQETGRETALLWSRWVVPGERGGHWMGVLRVGVSRLSGGYSVELIAGAPGRLLPS